MTNNRPEVLAPVGSPETLAAAVRCGADAVYLGAKQFSARRNAVNFSLSELKDACEYCHIRGVRVYLTLNIMLREDELCDALELVKSAAVAGIDGIIVQDLGLVRLIHTAIPDLPIHASTQMTVHSPAALSELKKMGISRVVVSRELSLEAIAEICKAAEKLDMTVEVFVHGALCMSVSGQCLLSAMLGGRSGNRGLCAGPCRLPFAAPKGTGYDLSLKDLSLFFHIDKLKYIGVASLKIEGRMKRPEYVAATTAACRAAVDTGFVPKVLEKALQNVFSRSGFTDGYLTGKTGKEMFGIRTREDVISANDAFPALHELYRNERQSIALSAKAVIRSDVPIELTLCDGKNTVTAHGDIPSPAKSRPADKESVKQSLTKFGGTPYHINDIEIHIDENLYVSGASLNALRRSAAEALNSLRAKPPEYTVTAFTVPATSVSSKHSKPYLIARFESIEQIPQSLDGVKAIMLPLEADLPDTLPQNVALIADVPRGILSESYIEKRLRLFAEKGFTYAYCGNIAALPIALKVGLKIIGGTGLNAANSQSVEILKDMGADMITLSPELLLSDIVKLSSPIPKGIFAYGRLPLMLMRNCPVNNGLDCKACGRSKALTDRKGVEFPIRCRVGFSELYNSLPIWLADRRDETAGLDYMLLWFTDETPDDISKIINMYNSGSPSDTKFTRGLYYRSVQ